VSRAGTTSQGRTTSGVARHLHSNRIACRRQLWHFSVATMLEERLKNTRNKPADTVADILAFLTNDLPNGGEQRFVNLFPDLCNLLFGAVLPPKDKESKHAYPHDTGGWFSLTQPWKFTTNVATSPRKVPDPVPNMIVNAKDICLLQAIVRETEERVSLFYRFPVQGLPTHLQEVLRKACTKQPLTALESMLVTQWRLFQQYEVMDYYMKRPKNAVPQLQLSMLEYFLVLFLRYPSAAPPKPVVPSIVHHSTYLTRSTIPHGEKVYQTVYQRMIPYLRDNRVWQILVASLWLHNSPISYKNPPQDLNDVYNQATVSYYAPRYAKYVRTLVEDAVIHRQDDAWMRAPLLEYICAQLLKGSIHNGKTFYAVVDLWLIYLEPWNVHHQKISTRHHKYTVDYKMYVQQRVALYLVPLAIFLRRSRELEFGKMNLVHKVLRVFSEPVVQVLEETLTTADYDTCGIPSNTPWTLQSLQDDFMGLVEEVQLLQLKKWRDMNFLEKRMYRLEAWMGSVTPEEALLRRIWKARHVCRTTAALVPVDLSSTLTQDHRTASQQLLRDAQGNLTDEGRRQIVTGLYKCDPWDIHAQNPQSVSSYEFAWSIPILQEWSTQLSTTLGFQVSLRFLADYRNYLPMILFLYMLPTLLGFLLKLVW